MDFNSPRIHLRCELLGPCEKDGALIGRGSGLNSWGWISNLLEFIYVVNCWGLVKRRVRAELMGMDFESPRIYLRCELLGPCEKEGLA